MKLHQFSDPDKISQACRDWLRASCHGNTVFLACGGSSAPIIAKAWSLLEPAEQARLRVSLTDERYGPVGHPDSNWKILGDLGMALSDPRHVPVLRSGLSREETVKAWGQDLTALLDWADTVIAFFGIGTDSHIAGIKPHSPAASEQTALAAGYQGEDFERITITPPVFACINSARVYIKGTEKRTALELVNQDLDPLSYPDQLIKQVGSYEVYYRA